MTYVVSLMSLPYGRVIKNKTRHTQEPFYAIMIKNKPNIDFPFFTYGIFRPGEIPFLGIKEFIDTIEKKEIRGNIKVRDGVFLYSNGNENINGFLLYFKKKSQQEAYNFIDRLEPYKLFRWGQKSNFNILMGKSPNKGSESIKELDGMYDNKYTTIKDPYFLTGLELLNDFKIPNWDLKLRGSFEIQMNYMFLWTIIERFSFLRYGLGKRPNERLNLLSENILFKEGLKKYVNEERKIFSSESLDHTILDKENSKKSINYYYQIRSNLTHRGKGIPKDYEILKKSFSELLKITEYVLKKTKDECENIKTKYEQ